MRTIQDEWYEYRYDVFPPTINGDAEERIRLAFLNGAMATAKIAVNGAATEHAVLRRVTRVMEDIERSFYESRENETSD